MRIELHIAEFYGYSERTIFSFKASPDEKLKERYNALANYKPFIKYHNKRRKKK